MNETKGKHISEQFDLELDTVRNKVLTMGGVVENQLADALRALSNQDLDLAEDILKNDSKVNALELEIDNACNKIIAKRQPTARDLRFVVTTLKSISDLERIGDEVKRLARTAQASYNSEQEHLLVSLENLGQLVVTMLHQALDAYARMDADAAFEVHNLDKNIDRQYEALLRQLMTYMMEDPRSIPKIMDVVFSARSLERIGDRCQNIAEYIIFNVHGKDVRHASAEDMQKALQPRK